MAQWEANILHEITVIGNDQNIDGTTTISEVNLVICDCNATETGMIIVILFYDQNFEKLFRNSILRGFS